MAIHWLYDIPDWLLAVLVVALTVGLSAGGFIATRRPLRARALVSNDVASAALGSVSLIYGVLLAMIAVAAWGNYTTAGDAMAREAGALADMFREFEGYPEPARRQLQTRVREYLNLVLTDEWPALRRGRSSERTVRARAALTREWAEFEPRAARERVLHQATAGAMTAFLDARRSRLSAGQAGLPTQLWMVVLLGAAITIGCTYFLRAEDERAQLVLISAVAALLGLVIFVILALDHPLWGAGGLAPDAFAEVARIIR